MSHRKAAKQDHSCNVNGSYVIFLVVMILLHFPNWSLRICLWMQNMKIIRNVASLQNTRFDEPFCCTVAETVMSLYLDTVYFLSSGYSELSSIGHETLMRCVLMSFHILSWTFMLICFTGRIWGFFFLFYKMSQKSFPSCVVNKFNMKTLLWSLTAYQLQLLNIISTIHFI